MDEASQQLIHEFCHATASTSVEDSPVPQTAEMTTPSNLSAPSVPTPDPMSPTMAFKTPILSGKFSDLTIIHGPESWKAHKVVICSQSPVLDAMISHLESDSSILHLRDYDQEAIRIMMEYFYTTTYTTVPSEPDFCLPLHTKVYILASKLQIAGLQALSSQLFTDSLVNHVTNIEVYLSSVREIYSKIADPSSALRVAVANIGVSEIPQILKDEKLWERFAQTMGEVPAFQRDVMCTMVENPASEVQVLVPELCEECGPRAADDGYQVTTTCKGCGVEKTFQFY